MASLRPSERPAAIRAFVQARMSSHRFPGKVLAPFRGQPLIRQVVAAVQRGLPSVPVTVLTSEEASDDPLAAYLGQAGIAVFRGPLDDVFGRFRRCAAVQPCGWFMRVSADSPLLDGRVLRTLVERSQDGRWDVVTTIFPRTFPSGQNADLVRTQALMAVDAETLSPDEREHVTPFFYRHPDPFRILNVESGDPRLADVHLAVDTIEDLKRLEQLSDEELPDCCPVLARR